MSLIVAFGFGMMGLAFGRLGLIGGSGASNGVSTAGTPIGLLLVLTKAS